MGTNYYVNIRPKQEVLDKFVADVQAGQLIGMKARACDLFRTYHLGKKSIGWKFLWNLNYDSWEDEYPLFEPNKKSIREFVMRDDVLIYDEYGVVVNKEKFLSIGFTDEGFDSDTYEENRKEGDPYYNSEYHISLDESTMFGMVERKGYKLAKIKTEFFSDGLRFSMCDDFC